MFRHVVTYTVEKKEKCLGVYRNTRSLYTAWKTMLNKIDHETDGSLKGKKHLVRRELCPHRLNGIIKHDFSVCYLHDS